MSGALPAFARRFFHPFRADESCDRLTGLADLAQFDRFLQHHLSLAAGGRPLTLMVIDLDRMRSVNDRYGELAGDRVFQSVAAVLESIARWQDLAARHGEGRMALAMPDTPLATGQRVADTIRRAVAAKIIACGADHIRITVSVGVAAAVPDGSSGSKASLFSAAEEALCAAKRAGQNCVKISQLTAAA